MKFLLVYQDLFHNEEGMKRNTRKRASKQENRWHNMDTSALTFSSGKDSVRKLGALNKPIVGLDVSEMNVDV